jgi:hypothetical protein
MGQAEKPAGHVSGTLIRALWMNEIRDWNMGEMIEEKTEALEKRNPKPMSLCK